MKPTSSAKELREKRAPLAKTIRQMADLVNNENRDFTAEEKANWDEVNADYNDLTRQIDLAERAEAVEAEQVAPLPNPLAGHGQPKGHDAGETERLRSLALQAWCRSQYGQDLSEEQVAACRAVGLKPHARELTIRLPSTAQASQSQRIFRSGHFSTVLDRAPQFDAAMSDYSGPTGAYLTAPVSMMRNLEINMLAFGGVRQVAESIRTATGERMAWPAADDTSNEGEQLGENTSIGASVEPSLTQIFWDAYKFSSKPLLVPYELLEDSLYDLPGMIGSMFGERIGRATNRKFTTGTGAGTPAGIVTKATAFAASSASAIVADDLIRLQHAVDPAYRTADAGFMMHDNIILAIRLLKDGMGNYLWQSGLQDNRPDRLLGSRVTINQHMDSTVASGKSTVLFGQLSKYKIRTVGSVRMYRLQERYRDTDQDGFIMLIREDGNLLDAGTAPVKALAH